MGWSYVINGERSVMLHDAWIESVVALMNREIQRRPGAYGPMESFVAGWLEYLPTTGPGTILLHLEPITSSDESCSSFERLLSAVEAAVDAFGEHVPADVLRTFAATMPGVTWGDLPTRIVRKGIAGFREAVAR